MGLLNPPRKSSGCGWQVAVLLVVGFGAIVAGRYMLEQPAQLERESAQAAQPAPSATAMATETPAPTHNWIIDTVQAGELEIIEMERLNLAAAGTLQVEESNQRQRQAQELHVVKLTEEAVLHTFAITSTQQANTMSINARLAENETARQITIEQHQLKLVLIIIVFAVVCGVILAVIVAVGQRLLAIWDNAETTPEPAQTAVYEIHQDGNIRRPLAGDVCSNRELMIIAGVWKKTHSLTVRDLQDAGISSERWGDKKDSAGVVTSFGLRSRLVQRGILELVNPESERHEAVPTDDGEEIFKKVTE